MDKGLNIRIKRQRNVYGEGWKLGPEQGSTERVNACVRETLPYDEVETLRLFVVHAVCWLILFASLTAEMYLNRWL